MKKFQFINFLFILFFVKIGLCASMGDEDIVYYPATDLSIKFSHVGQGNGVFIKNVSNGKYFIVDAGSSKQPLNIIGGERGLALNLLTYFGCDATNNMPLGSKLVIVVTHPDKDHINLFRYFKEKLGAIFIGSIELCYLGGNFLHYVSGPAQQFFESLVVPLAEMHESKVKSLSHRLDDGQLSTYKPWALSSGQKVIIDALSFPFFMHLKISGFLDACQHMFNLEILAANAMHDEDYNYIFDDGYLGLESIPYVELGKNTGPTYEDSEAVNGNGAIIKISSNNKNIILMGDAVGKTTTRLLKYISPYELRASILMASHHGASSHETNSPLWALSTSPEILIFSCPLISAYNHPKFDALFNYLVVNSLQEEEGDGHDIYFERPISFYDHMLDSMVEICRRSLSLLELNIYSAEGRTVLKAKTKKRVYTTSSILGGDAFTFSLNAAGMITKV